MNKYILAVVGDSGSGKTTMCNAMSVEGIPEIVSYTTRPMRDDETNGVQHHFIDTQTAIHIIEHNKIAATTVFGGYRYFTLMNQFLTFEGNVCSYVIDEAGLVELMDVFSDVDGIEIIPVKVIRTFTPSSNEMRERVKRDQYRISLPADFYKYTINNIYDDVESFKDYCKGFAKEIVNNIKHSYQ